MRHPQNTKINTTGDIAYCEEGEEGQMVASTSCRSSTNSNHRTSFRRPASENFIVEATEWLAISKLLRIEVHFNSTQEDSIQCMYNLLFLALQM